MESPGSHLYQHLPAGEPESNMDSPVDHFPHFHGLGNMFPALFTQPVFGFDVPGPSEVPLPIPGPDNDGALCPHCYGGPGAPFLMLGHSEDIPALHLHTGGYSVEPAFIPLAQTPHVLNQPEVAVPFTDAPHADDAASIFTSSPSPDISDADAAEASITVAPPSTGSPRPSRPRAARRRSTGASGQRGRRLSRRKTSRGQRSTKKDRPLYCIFNFAGCDEHFPAKNEWKRHIKTMHLAESYWRCPDCKVSPAKTFSRSDLFQTHYRRTHLNAHSHDGHEEQQTPFQEQMNKAAMVDAQSRAQKKGRAAPLSMACADASCDEVFQGDEAWDHFLEHTARHLLHEAETQKRNMLFGDACDNFTMWSLKEGFVRPGPNGWELCKPELPSDEDDDVEMGE